MRRVVLAATVAAALAAPALARAQAGDWVFLGQRDVDFRADRDVIPVTVAAGVFRQIVLEVQGNGVEIFDLTVRFVDGTSASVPVRQVVPAGARTRAIDLPGELRAIQSVDLTYRTVGRPRRGRATVSLFGHRGRGAPPPPTSAVAPAPMVAPPPRILPPPPPPPPPPGDDWVVLGERRVDPRLDRDVIVVTAAAGAYRRIQLEVEGNAVELFDLTVRFGDGSFELVEVREVVPAGGRTREIDLPGGRRFIQSADLVYRSMGRGRRGGATVRLLGLPGRGRGHRGHGGPYGGVEPAAAPAAPLAPAPGGWDVLGERMVSLRVDRDLIPVTAVRGRFRGLALQVGEAPVHLIAAVVTLADGSQVRLALDGVIPAGGQSGTLMFPGGPRAVRSVELLYRTVPTGWDRAQVRLLGLR